MVLIRTRTVRIYVMYPGVFSIVEQHQFVPATPACHKVSPFYRIHHVCNGDSLKEIIPKFFVSVAREWCLPFDIEECRCCVGTGAKLSIREHESDANMRNVEMEGTYEQIERATEMVRQFLQHREIAPQRAAALGSHNFKTKLCENYSQGTCTFADRCHFAHGTLELRSSNSMRYWSWGHQWSISFRLVNAPGDKN